MHRVDRPFWRLRGAILVTLAMGACGSPGSVRRVGQQADGTSVLPTGGWTLTPAGEQVPVGDLPLAMAVSADGKWLAVTNNGYTDQFVSIIDLDTGKPTDSLPMRRSWLGLAFNPTGDRLYVSGGADDAVESFRFADGHAEHLATLPLGAARDTAPAFAAGLAVSPDGQTVLVAALRRNQVARIALTGRRPARFIDVGKFPYTVVMDRAGRTAYVSNWGEGSISVVDLNANREIVKIAVGSHPTAMCLSPDGTRLYVADANSDDVTVLDLPTRTVVEVIDLAPYPDAPAGSTPNGVALAPDGGTLYVVNADNNDVAVVDVTSAPARVQGLIPTGWYPTAVAFDSTRHRLLVANGKGLGSRPNPGGPQPGVQQPQPVEDIKRILHGTVSLIPVPDDTALARYTSQVMANNGFDAMRQVARAGEERSGPTAPAQAIPRHVGEPSLIEHVFYIIKENRTYDQILGDLPQGDGDSTLTLFGRDVTPNAHALAETFVLFDNFYVDAEVSATGHEWSTAAIATDFVEKLWPTNYSDRGFPYPGEGEFEIAYPDAGYLWDAAARAGITYRSYGEFAGYAAGDTLPARSLVANLEGHVAPWYPPWDLDVPDTARATAFIQDFTRLVQADAVPALNVIRLPNDHTAGTRPGMPTPSSMVADNDVALGRIIEAISQSPVWQTSVIFVLEDDAQNGPDHVDAHRSIAFVASPYARRGFVDHAFYDTAALLRTIELILGLPPMTQFDAAAVPMHRAFRDEPDATAYAVRPNLFPLDSLNTAQSPGAEASLRMNFAELDAAPEELLNEIIWKSVKGAASQMPKPHTTRGRRADDDDEGRR